MIISNNIISITDIRQNATTCINDLKEGGDKVIFRNNKPTAVLVDFNRYEKLIKRNFSIEELDGSEEVIGTLGHNDFISLLKRA